MKQIRPKADTSFDEEMELIAYAVATCPECGCAMDKYKDEDGSIILMCCGCEHIIRPDKKG